jgi:hypothetical protein
MEMLVNLAHAQTNFPAAVKSMFGKYMRGVAAWMYF